MGVLSQVRQGRALPALAAALAVAVAVTGCEPRDGGGVSSISVAVTTDRVASRALEKGGVGVRWLTCTADLKSDRTVGASASGESRRTGRTDATVNCRGRTENDKDIKVTGKVTYVRENHCVRGDLTGKVDGRKVFEAKVIGECDGGGRETERPGPTRSHPWHHRTTAGSGTQGK
ncbi:hypothetical protein ABZU86_12580 [Streptomyces sp. NPDC005271]|uniref:hypothetical protein n=1 Tax=unclassified Streptomyces TaxID=2593676 RepID=UPI0033AB7376